MDLVEFLTARLDEDQAAAEANARTVGHSWYVSGDEAVYSNDHPNLPVAVGPWSGSLGEETAEHIARHDPARVLAEVEAKRQVVEIVFRYEATIDDEWGCCHSADEIRQGQCTTDVNELPGLRVLALPYAAHPDYHEEWRPQA